MDYYFSAYSDSPITITSGAHSFEEDNICTSPMTNQDVILNAPIDVMATCTKVRNDTLYIREFFMITSPQKATPT